MKPQFQRKLLNRATIILGLVLFVLVFGTLGFRFTQDWSWFTAFYAALMTLATMGVGPLNQLSHEGEIIHIIMIFLSLAAISVAIGLFTQAVIEFELGSFFGRRRMEKEITQLKDHFIVCGAGRVGRRIALEIRARNHPVVIVEKETPRAEWAYAQNFPVIIGDASSEATLRQARIEFARGLASAVTSDAQNVYIVLTARGIAPELPIIARASEDGAESKLLRAGATTVLSPYTYAGTRMARMLTRPNVQRFLDLALSSLSEGDLDLQIEEVQVGENSKLSGTSLSEAEIRKRLGIIILAIRRKNGRLEFNPGPDHEISSGDFLIAMGDSRKLKDLEVLAGIS